MNEDDHDDDESLQPGDRRENETEEEAKSRKRKERLEQNRISARESRKRKKTMIEELQRTVITLSRENKDLNERNESLRRQLMEIGSKVRVDFVKWSKFHVIFINLRMVVLYRHETRVDDVGSCTSRGSYVKLRPKVIAI
jgi:bZIP transcription factor